MRICLKVMVAFACPIYIEFMLRLLMQPGDHARPTPSYAKEACYVTWTMGKGGAAGYEACMSAP